MRLAAVSLMFLFLSLHAWAGGVPTGYARTLWQAKDGLPEETVQTFAQTTDGYLWIGTSGGLLRFDGAHFSLFNRDNTQEFAENSVWCLMTARDGTLWIGTEGGGLLSYREGRFRAYSTANGLTDGFVRAVFEDSGGTIWIGTDDGLFRFANQHLVRIDGTESAPALAVHAIVADHRGRLWVGGSRLLMFDHGTVREFRLKGDSSGNRVKSILETRDGAVWVGTVSGLQRLIGSDSFERVKPIAGTVRVLHEGSDGSLWIGTIGHGIFLYRNGTYSQIDAPSGIPSNTVLNVFEDAEKNLWIGTQVGMVRLSKTPLSIVSLPDATDSDFGTVYQDRDGTLWVGSTHLFHLVKGVAEQKVFPGIGGAKVRNLLRDSTGALWLGTDGSGVFRLVGNRAFHFTTQTGLTNNFTRVFLQARDGSVWIGADEGVSHWTPRGFDKYEVRNGLCYFSVRALLEDRRGDLWIGTDRGLSRLHNGQFEHDLATESLSNEKVWTIHEDADGGLWFGTRNGGLYRFRSGKLTHYTTAQGLASNRIYQILEDTAGKFWVSGPNGVSVLKRSELDAAADNPLAKVSLTFYGISEEVQTTQLYGGTQSSGCLGQQGDVWFPTNRGPLRIVSAQPRPVDKPRLVITRVLADGRESTNVRGVSLAPGSSALEVSYAPIMLRSQQDIRFRYKLDGFDKDWNDVGSRRVAYYTSLPPGRYTFHAAAFELNDPGVLSEVSLEIKQRAHFYRMPWFLASCALLLAALTWGAHEMRVRQMRARFEAVLSERGRLAREMHDTVIQGCANASALLEASSSMEPSDKDLARELSNCARTQIRTTIEEARRAVWNLRHGETIPQDIGSSIQRIAEHANKESNVPVEFRCYGDPFPLPQLATHELLMVAREAVHNAVVHAHPASIQINLHYGPEELLVEVSDDGCGFDPEEVMGPDDQHYGLTVMEERTQRIGATLHVKSTVGRGTTLSIEVPKRQAELHATAQGARS